jgi:predicted nucleic acid-binding protein
VSDFVLDASLALQWFFEDETDRLYALSVLQSLAENRAVVPILWFYEVGNGLLMASRRTRINKEQFREFMARLGDLPIEPANQSSNDILELPAIANAYGLTNYDAAYLALALDRNLPLATADSALRKAANLAGVGIA